MPITQLQPVPTWGSTVGQSIMNFMQGREIKRKQGMEERQFGLEEELKKAQAGYYTTRGQYTERDRLLRYLDILTRRMLDPMFDETTPEGKEVIDAVGRVRKQIESLSPDLNIGMQTSADINPLTGKPRRVFEAPTEYLRTQEVPEILSQRGIQPSPAPSAVGPQPGPVPLPGQARDETDIISSLMRTRQPRQGEGLAAAPEVPVAARRPYRVPIELKDVFTTLTDQQKSAVLQIGGLWETLNEQEKKDVEAAIRQNPQNAFEILKRLKGGK